LWSAFISQKDQQRPTFTRQSVGFRVWLGLNPELAECKKAAKLRHSPRL
jgi:hypothetical protein